MDTVLIFDTVRKMLANKDSHESILSFLDKVSLPVQMESLRKEILDCKGCNLHPTIHVPFIGNIYGEVILVGEAPSEQDTVDGVPFSGPSGQFLNRMLEAASAKIHERWTRENLFITNVINCRSLTDDGKIRPPAIQEIAMCKKYLDKQIDLIKPKLIICLGAVAAETLIHPHFKITEEHGKFFNDTPKFIAIYHPSYVLHKGEDTAEGRKLKIEMWNDLISANNFLNTIGANAPSML